MRLGLVLGGAAEGFDKNYKLMKDEQRADDEAKAIKDDRDRKARGRTMMDAEIASASGVAAPAAPAPPPAVTGLAAIPGMIQGIFHHPATGTSVHAGIVPEPSAGAMGGGQPPPAAPQPMPQGRLTPSAAPSTADQVPFDPALLGAPYRLPPGTLDGTWQPPETAKPAKGVAVPTATATGGPLPPVKPPSPFDGVVPPTQHWAQMAYAANQAGDLATARAYTDKIYQSRADAAGIMIMNAGATGSFDQLSALAGQMTDGHTFTATPIKGGPDDGKFSVQYAGSDRPVVVDDAMDLAHRLYNQMKGDPVAMGQYFTQHASDALKAANDKVQVSLWNQQIAASQATQKREDAAEPGRRVAETNANLGAISTRNLQAAETEHARAGAYREMHPVRAGGGNGQGGGSGGDAPWTGKWTTTYKPAFTDAQGTVHPEQASRTNTRGDIQVQVPGGGYVDNGEYAAVTAGLKSGYVRNGWVTTHVDTHGNMVFGVKGHDGYTPSFDEAVALRQQDFAQSQQQPQPTGALGRARGATGPVSTRAAAVSRPAASAPSDWDMTPAQQADYDRRRRSAAAVPSAVGGALGAVWNRAGSNTPTPDVGD